MKLRVEIELGNAAMQTGDDLAESLRKGAAMIQFYLGSSEPGPEQVGHSRSIRDANGNQVGYWKLMAGEVDHG